LVKCYDIYTTINNCYIITEFCNEGDLENLLKKRDKLPEEEAVPIFKDVIHGYSALADAGFLHRDLKPAKILIKDKVAKIADFGFLKRTTLNHPETINLNASPEALKNNVFTIKGDIWSLGVLFYEMLHGRTPWEPAAEKELLDKMLKQNYTLNRNLSEDLKDFIKKCLTYD
jgi:serine/threonine protein kinase